MGEEREIGASVLAGARPVARLVTDVRRQAGQRRPRASHAAGTGVVRREWRARAEPRCPGAGSARSAALAPLRVPATWSRGRAPPQAGGAPGARARVCARCRVSVSRFVSSSSPSNTQSLPSTSLRTCSFFPSRQTHTPLARRARRTAANARAVPQGRCCTCCPASRVPGRRASRSSLLSVLPLEKRSARPPRCDADMSPPW